jgi:hypothetical protein
MELKVYRYSSQSQTTLGALHINGEFECYTLEDQHQDIKVKGETRIPKGTYNIGLRTVGGFDARYKAKFSFHKGMLQVLNVPGFEYILIHIGNDEDDTAGCLLVGNTANNNRLNKGFIGDSTNTYKSLYTKVLKAIESGLDVTIQYIDL